MMYFQKRHKAGFPANVTTALPLPGLAGGDTEAFSGPKLPPLIGQRPQDPRNGKTVAKSRRTWNGTIDSWATPM
jgi:hypothetical protein